MISSSRRSPEVRCHSFICVPCTCRGGEGRCQVFFQGLTPAEFQTVLLLLKCTPAGPRFSSRRLIGAKALDATCLFLRRLSYSPFSLESRLKLKLFSLCFLSFADKPPHFTPAQPPDGESSASCACALLHVLEN